MSDIYPPVTQVYGKKQTFLKIYWKEKILWHLFLLEFTQIYLCRSVQSAKFAIICTHKIVILRGMNRRTTCTTSYQTWEHKSRDRKKRFRNRIFMKLITQCFVRYWGHFELLNYQLYLFSFILFEDIEKNCIV